MTLTVKIFEFKFEREFDLLWKKYQIFRAKNTEISILRAIQTIIKNSIQSHSKFSVVKLSPEKSSKFFIKIRESLKIFR